MLIAANSFLRELSAYESELHASKVEFSCGIQFYGTKNSFHANAMTIRSQNSFLLSRISSCIKRFVLFGIDF